jgi:sulfur-oxidizing protein SoxA
LPIAPGERSELRPFVDLGSRLFHRRQGQLNLSCSQCHDDNWGKRLAGAVIPQAHPTGYPVYRLEWQSLGSLQRRLRNCMIGVRAEPYEYGAPEAVALELYLMARARGMPLEPRRRARKQGRPNRPDPPCFSLSSGRKSSRPTHRL